MILIVLLFCFLFVGVLLFKRTLKIRRIVLAVLFGMGLYFLYGMSIEDYYGSNNHIYFHGKKGRRYCRYGRQPDSATYCYRANSEKTCNRVWIISKKETLDLIDWIEKKLDIGQKYNVS